MKDEMELRAALAAHEAKRNRSAEQGSHEAYLEAGRAMMRGWEMRRGMFGIELWKHGTFDVFIIGFSQYLALNNVMAMGLNNDELARQEASHE